MKNLLGSRMLVDSWNGGTIEMSQDQIAKTWRERLIHKLRDHYGLAEKQAQERADAWMQWIGQQTSLRPQNLVAAVVQDQSSPRPRDSNVRCSKSRSTARRVVDAPLPRLRKSRAR
jgi:hypothetical protein